MEIIKLALCSSNIAIALEAKDGTDFPDSDVTAPAQVIQWTIRAIQRNQL